MSVDTYHNPESDEELLKRTFLGLGTVWGRIQSERSAAVREVLELLLKMEST